MDLLELKDFYTKVAQFITGQKIEPKLMVDSSNPNVLIIDYGLIDVKYAIPLIREQKSRPNHMPDSSTGQPWTYNMNGIHYRVQITAQAACGKAGHTSECECWIFLI